MRRPTRHWLLMLLALMPMLGLPVLAAETAETQLTIATRHIPPFSMKTETGWEGITIDLVEDIAKAMGARIHFREMGLEEMLQQTREGRIDAVAGALTITHDRELTMDFTHSYFSSGLGVATQRKSSLSDLSLIRGFSSGAFLKSVGGLLALLTLVGLLLWLMERRHNQQFSRHPLKGIGSGIWWSAVTMTTVGYGDKAPQSLGGRVIGLIWMFASIIMISGFTAAIATSLTIDHLDKEIRGVHDLYGKRIVTLAESTSARYLNDHLLRHETAPSIKVALERLAKQEVDVVVYDLPVLQHYVNAHYPEQVRVLPQSFEQQDYGLALPQGSKLREPFNLEILRIIHEPSWQHNLKRYLGDGHNAPAERSE